MKNITLHLHTTLDGFAAGPKGEMDWIKIDEEMFDFVGKLTDESDTALYGRVTWQMMDSYWPTAADKPNASKHDREHSNWYNNVDKVVLSRSMKDKVIDKTSFIGKNLVSEITKLKKQKGKNIIIFGSPGAAHSLMEYNFIDNYWLFVNPVILGQGIPVFSSNIKHRIKLKSISTKVFSSGVTALNYSVER